MTPWLLALLARAVLILPPLSQHLTFPLLSVTLLVSFGSSMLYGYNLAVVNSPAEVRVGQPLWEQGKWLCIPPLEGGVTAVQKPHTGIFLEQPPRGEQHGRDVRVRVHVRQTGPLRKEGLQSWPQPPCSSLSAVCSIFKSSLGGSSQVLRLAEHIPVIPKHVLPCISFNAVNP